MCLHCGGEGVVLQWVREGDAVTLDVARVTEAGRTAAVEAYEAEGLTAWDVGPCYGDPPPVAWLPEGPSKVEWEQRTEGSWL
jgi:hypothetical protein